MGDAKAPYYRLVVSSMILRALIPRDLGCVIPWDLVCAVDHIVDDDDDLAMRLAYKQLSFSRYA